MLVVMMAMAVALIVLFTVSGIAGFDSHSLIALLVVIVAAAISGAAFSWKRYTRRTR